MFEIIGAHLRKLGRAFKKSFEKIAAGIEADDRELKWQGIQGLIGLLVPRTILWGIPGIYYASKGGDVLGGYIEGVVIFYVVAAILAAATPAPPVPEKKEDVPVSDEIARKHAQQGLDNLLDILLIVGESLATRLTGAYTIECPKTRGQLAYPHINRCINVKGGVASTMVAFPYTGEIDQKQFMERFNDRLCQMLNAYEVPGRPNPVFIGSDNVPRTSIQAIHADKVGDRIILEVIRVTEAAIPLLDELDRAGSNPTEQETLYDDDL